MTDNPLPDDDELENKHREGIRVEVMKSIGPYIPESADYPAIRKHLDWWVDWITGELDG